MRSYLFVLLALAVLSTGAIAKEIVLDGKATQASSFKLVSDTIRSRAEASISFEIRIGKLDASEIETPRGRFTQLSLPGFQHSSTVGAPALPVMNKLVEVPIGAELEIRLEGSKVQSYTLSDLGVKNLLMPRQPPHPKDGTVVPFAFEQAAYVTQGFFQDEIVSVEEVGMLRDKRLVLVKVAPVSYDATAGKIEVHTDARVKVTLKNSDLAKTARIKKVYRSPYFAAFGREMLVPPSIAGMKVDEVKKPVTYAIVADRSFENDLKPFIEWKTQKGFNVQVGYTDQVGKTAEQIKTWVHGLYNNPGENAPPSFLLLVGDNEQVPSFPGKSGSHLADLYFVAVTSGDNIPDIVTGRFSASNSDELVPQIAKTLQYEKYQMPDPTFLKNTVMIAGWDYSHAVEWGWPQINYGTKYYFNAEHGTPNTAAFLSAGSDQNEAQIKEKLNAGACYVNYTAHGSTTSWADPGLTKSDIDAMTNASAGVL
jgi:hypothetical protein